MSSPKPKKTITVSAIKAMIGAVLFFFGVLLILSPYTHLKVLAYGLVFVLGGVGFYALCFAFLAQGIYLVIFRKPLVKIRFHVNFGVLLLALGVFLLVADLGTQGQAKASTFQTFLDVLNDKFHSLGGITVAPELLGGSLGYLLAGAINENVGRFLTIIIYVVLLLGGLVSLLFPQILRLVRFLGAKRAIAKAEKQKQKERAERGEDELTIGGEDDNDDSPLIASPVEELAPFPSRPTPPTASSGEAPVFTRAGSMPVAGTRRAYQAAHQNPTSPDPSFSQEMPTPSSNAYRNASGQTVGLQKAFFDPYGTRETEPQSAPEPAPAIHAPVWNAGNAAVTPTPQPVAPTPIEPAPMNSASEEAVTPNFAPRVEPVAPTPVSAPAPTPLPSPMQTPVAPAPNPAPVTPVSQPAPQATPAPEPEPEPSEEDLENAPLPPYELPPVSLLKTPSAEDIELQNKMEEDCKARIAVIDQVFKDMDVGAHVADYTIGPSVTRYIIKPDNNVSVSTVAKVTKDIESRLSGKACRFQERVIGHVGCAIEIANEEDSRRTISFHEVFTALPDKPGKECEIPFGVTIDGVALHGDLSSFPHMLVCGTTGSGKSVYVHSIICSLLMRNRPELLKLVLVDPKRVEMTKYKEIPHLLCPIIKESSHARVALKKLCTLMDKRYDIFEETGVRDIREYNSDYAVANNKRPMSFIIVFIDEFADLINTEKDVDFFVGRLGQKARACGIHLVVCTQRPDTKVINGNLKSNLPGRVALHVKTGIDSRTILGSEGAEDLNDHGDMLVDCGGLSRDGFVRAQGCFLTNAEITAITNHIRGQQKVVYSKEFLDLEDHDKDEASPIPAGMNYVPGQISNGSSSDAAVPSQTEIKAASNEEKYQLIKRAIMAREYTSISQIQRDFSVGFPRAGKIFHRLQEEGIVDKGGDAANSSKGSRVLIHEDPGAISESESASMLNVEAEPAPDAEPAA
ncbi:MAG: hypothetical protein HUJ60_01015 [Bacilli bacterium]|nr:hypothetical protein [Bacilli bacterium]